MKNKQFDDDVRDFITQQKGVFLLVSADPLFNKNLRSTLFRHLAVRNDCVQYVASMEHLPREIKRLKAAGRRPLIFLERELGGRNTAELIRYLKGAFDTSLYVVMLTTEVQRDKLVLMHELGADNIITKPISPDTLVEKIAFTIKPRGQLGEFMDRGHRSLEAGDAVEAANMATKVLELKPNSPSGLLLLGDAFRVMGKRDEALLAYSKAEKGAKLFLEPLKKIADLYHDEGNYTEELRILQRLDKLSPLNVDRKMRIGADYVQIGDKEKAKASFDRAIRLATKEALNTVSRITQAIAAMCMDTAPELAELYLRQALNTRKHMLDRSDIETFNRLGLMLRRQGKWQEAITEYRHALRISPQDPGLFYNIAMAYTEGRQYIEACQHLEQALNINPDLWRSSDTICLNIATVFRRFGKSDTAADFLRKALTLNPESAKATAMLAEITGQ